MNNERQVMGKLGLVIPIDTCLFDVNLILNHSKYFLATIRGRSPGSLLKPLISLGDSTRARVKTASREEGVTPGRITRTQVFIPEKYSKSSIQARRMSASYLSIAIRQGQ